LPAARFETVIRASKNYKDSALASIMDDVWQRIKTEVYFEEDPLHHIAFPDKGGQSSYYSSNVTSEDAKFVDEFCQQEKISPLNTMLLLQDGVYRLLVYSEHTDYHKFNAKNEYQFKGKTI
jgi:hypothetical protein